MDKTAEEASTPPGSDREFVSDDYSDVVEGCAAGMSSSTCFVCVCLKQTIAPASMTSVETPTDALPGKAEVELSITNLKRVCECATCTSILQVLS
jgi:hypothetical protein